MEVSLRWFSSVVRVSIEHFNTREEVLAAEKAAILNEHPIYNVRHNNVTLIPVDGNYYSYTYRQYKEKTNRTIFVIADSEEEAIEQFKHDLTPGVGRKHLVDLEDFEILVIVVEEGAKSKSIPTRCIRYQVHELKSPILDAFIKPIELARRDAFRVKDNFVLHSTPINFAKVLIEELE